ncbi:hypothetical protein FHS21_004840 [Phyllobacterium trifolii]|uniref:Uncharacterized protein n=1 Tax=Phyllobacterium trifolii TaxID=300193 RepID=A0A839UF16_9HYPH|nr:hypothetical protein [Phyllobacterium trifolii]MBB3148393.1 hypothetical protein [Phyllobacterium trifolii]
MAEADQDDDAASALRRSLAEMADEDDVRREGAARTPRGYQALGGDRAARDLAHRIA